MFSPAASARVVEKLPELSSEELAEVYRYALIVDLDAGEGDALAHPAAGRVDSLGVLSSDDCEHANKVSNAIAEIMKERGVEPCSECKGYGEFHLDW